MGSLNRAVACQAVDLMRAPPSPDVPGALSAGGRLRLAQYDRVVGEGEPMLLDGVNHVAWFSKAVARLGAFSERVFDAAVVPTRPPAPRATLTLLHLPPPTHPHLPPIHTNPNT